MKLAATLQGLIRVICASLETQFLSPQFLIAYALRLYLMYFKLAWVHMTFCPAERWGDTKYKDDDRVKDSNDSVLRAD